MTQEDKRLLLKDLCARLPYGVHCCVLNLNKTIKEDNDIIYGIVGDNIVTLKSDKNECYMYYQIKPYLRSMSSMTEEEKEERFNVSEDDFSSVRQWCKEEGENENGIPCPATYKELDWLNSHHFDYRGLLDKDLAIEALEGMYK